MQAPGASAGLAQAWGWGGRTARRTVPGECGERAAMRMDEGKGRGCFAG